jgi:NADH-quinone oxidoreductase subunit B
VIAADRLHAYRLAGEPRLRVVVASLGLACCAMEVESAVRLGLLVAEDDRGGDGAEGIDADTSTVLLVAGTVTDALAPAVLALAAGLPAGSPVVSFGACAGTGGPYWDAPTVMKGVDQLVPVALYVPGCPPRPEALVAGLATLLAATP